MFNGALVVSRFWFSVGCFYFILWWRGWGAWVQFWEVRGPTLVNVFGMHPRSRSSSPDFDDTRSLGYPPRRVVYPFGFHWVTASRFLAGNREAKLKPTTPCFPLFPLLLTPTSLPQRYSACWGYNNYYGGVLSSFGASFSINSLTFFVRLIFKGFSGELLGGCLRG